MSQFPLSKLASDSWENEGGSVHHLSYSVSMGVRRILTETFVVDGYSYTSLADAVAQARRPQEPRTGL